MIVRVKEKKLKSIQYHYDKKYNITKMVKNRDCSIINLIED